MVVRDAELEEHDQLATLWFNGWTDAHARIVPMELTRVRTLENFRDRLAKMLTDVHVIGPLQEPAGFYALKDDELYQLFVASDSRGTGVAQALIADAEARLAASGVATAWLACAIGNDRAARFYEKCGWHRVGTMTNHLETTEGTFLLQVWRYEKLMEASI